MVHIMHKNYAYYSKIEALREIFDIENIHSKWTSRKISSSEFLEIISQNTYSLKDATKLSSQAICNLNKKLFADKPNNMKVCSYLLHKYNLKYCPNCNHVYLLEYFHCNKNKSTGTQDYCKDCFNLKVRTIRKEYTAYRKALKIKAIPNWANIEIINEIYKKCPEGCHVDHIIPLVGKLVCGLHVENNLQYLTASENIQKSNKFIPE